MSRGTLMIYLMTQELFLIAQWVAIELIPSHAWSIEELYLMIVMVTTTKLLSKMTMQRSLVYQMTILKI